MYIQQVEMTRRYVRATLSLDSAWQGTVFEIKIIHSRYISLVVYIYIVHFMCV